MYAGEEDCTGQMMKEYRSGDNGRDCVIIFDKDPANAWPLKVKIVVQTRCHVVRMTVKNEDISLQNNIGKDKSTSWYICFGGTRERKDITFYDVVPFLVEKDSEKGAVLWSPCPEDMEKIKTRMEYKMKESQLVDDPRPKPMEFRMNTHQDAQPGNMMRNSKEMTGNDIDQHTKFPETAIMRYADMIQARVKTFKPTEMRRVTEPEGPSHQPSTVNMSTSDLVMWKKEILERWLTSQDSSVGDRIELKHVDRNEASTERERERRGKTLRDADAMRAGDCADCADMSHEYHSGTGI